MKYITLKIDWEIMIVDCFVSRKIRKLYFYLGEMQYRQTIVSINYECWIFLVFPFDFTTI